MDPSPLIAPAPDPNSSTAKNATFGVIDTVLSIPASALEPVVLAMQGQASVYKVGDSGPAKLGISGRDWTRGLAVAQSVDPNSDAYRWGSRGAMVAIVVVGARATGGAPSPPRLIHLTDNAGKLAIESGSKIIGRHGIFAVPESVANEATLFKLFRSGLPPSRTTQAVAIPESAGPLFVRPTPLGPYSAMKYFGGVRVAPPGVLNTATGEFVGSGTLLGPRSLIYGPDVLIYVVVGGSAAAYWYETAPEPEE